MQAMILAAGKGSRLKELTKENTKCMLEVNGERLIDSSLSKLAAVGITKLIMVVGYKKDNLREYLGVESHGIKIEYVDNDDYDTTNNIYSLYLAREYLKQEDTLLLESDLIYDENILQGVLADSRESLAVVDKFQSWMDGTVVTVDDQHKITRFIPKTEFDFSEANHYYKTVNIYKFSKAFSTKTYVPFLEAYSQALGHNEYYEQVLRVVLQLEDQELEAYLLNGESWYEIDDVQDKDNAEVIFAQTPELKLKLVSQRYGGYWRYPAIIDFCYLVNPYFPNNFMLDEIRSSFEALIRQYPSGASVHKLLAGKLFNIDPESIIVANGAAEIINALKETLTGTFGIMCPTFDEYINAIGGDRVVTATTKQPIFAYTLEDLLELSSKVDNLIVINPDNPSGYKLPGRDMYALLMQLHKDGKNLIIDESFLDFSENSEEESFLKEDIIKKYKNLIVIKSISKSYGVPGTRLGIAVTSNAEWTRILQNKLSIWNINSFGEFFLQIIGKYQKKYLESCRIIIKERSWFLKELIKLDSIKPIPSESNYFLAKVVGKLSATQLTEQLLFGNNILIKDLTNKKGCQNDNYVRIAVRGNEDNQALINAIRHLENSFIN